MADEDWVDPENEDMEEDSTDYIEAIDSTAPDDSDELPSDEGEDDEDTIIDAEADDTIPDEEDDAGDASGTAEDVEAIDEDEPDEDAELPTDEDEADESEDLDEDLPDDDADDPTDINDNQATLPCICSVKQGDTVMVAMRNGEPTIIGRAGWGDGVDEATAAAQASADDAAEAAAAAQSSADSAASAASAAQTSADAAATAAATAQSTANSAASAASAAQTSADAAATAASNAQDSADAANDALQSVVSGATTVEKAVSVMQTALEAVVDYDADNDTTTEYFWHDSNGAHVLGDTSGYRNDLTSSGMNVVEVSTEGSVASFGADGAQIGKDGESHLDMDYHSMQLLDKDGDAYFKVNDARNENGLAYIEEKFIGSGTNQVFTSNYLVSRSLKIFIDGVESSDFRTENVYLETGLKTRFLFTNSTPPDQSVIVAKFYTTDPAYAFTYGTRSTTSATGVYSAVLGIGNAASNIASTAIGRYSQASGEYSYAEGYGTKASGDYSHANGYRTTASGVYSHGEGEETTASGSTSHAEGYQTTASGAASHAEGQLTEANGNFAHAEGSHTTASSDYAHAEGYYTEAGWKAHAEGESTVASGYRSHSEGDQTTASGHDSHAEGGGAVASGAYSHAEGYYTTASGDYSHAQNLGTIAASGSQTALGQYNVEDNADTYAVIVGNGTASDARSNALTVDWDGNVQMAGDATIRASNIDRDGTPPSTNQTSDGRFRIADVDNEAVAYYDGYRLTTGETGARLVAFAEDANGNSITNTFRVGKKPDGSNLYHVTDPAAFREAVNAAGVSDQSAQNVFFSPMTNSAQLGAWYWNVTNTADSSSGDRVAAIFNDNRLQMYNSTDKSTLWSTYTTASPQPADAWDVNKSTTVSQVITAGSGRTVSSVTYAEWGKVAMLSVSISGWAASTGSQTGGTVVSGKRPVHDVYATEVSSRYAVYAQLTTAGALTVSWSAAPSTSTAYTIRFIYILA